MAASFDPDRGAQPLTLPAVLDLTAAEPLRASLCEALNGRTSLELDASAVDQFSTVCAQVLLACGRTAASAGVTLKIRPSSQMRHALESLGLIEEFANWMI